MGIGLRSSHLVRLLIMAGELVLSVLLKMSALHAREV